MEMHDTDRYGRGAIGIWCLRRGMLALAGALLLFLAIALTHPLGVAAATVTVTTTADVTNPCATSGTGTCSLPDAVTFANNNDSTTIAFSVPNPSTITLSGGTLFLTRTTGSGMTITGPGAAALAIDGHCTLTGSVCTSGGATVFTVADGVTASLSGLTIQHGNTTVGGGGIYNSGVLTVTNCTLRGNNAIGGDYTQDGGGILNTGTLTVTNSTLSVNSAANFGGGIFNNHGTVTVTGSTLSGNSRGSGGGIANYDGTMTVTNSTLSGNTTASGGGGIYNDSGGLTVTNSTLSGNSAPGGVGGGILNNSGTLTVTNSTLSGNSAFTLGGGIYFNVDDGTVTLTNTIVAGNAVTAPGGSGPDLLAGIVSGGHNLIGDTEGSSGWVPSDLTDSPLNPLLGTLGNNGGPTPTIALLPGSPAIDAGNDAVCAQTGVGKVNGVDQRGITRPQRAHCDIGAFEALPPPTPLPGPKPPGSAGGVPHPLPAVRPAGSPGGAPNPLPVPRP